MSERVRLGLIGCGNNMAFHVKRLGAHPAAEIVGLADPVPASVERLLTRYPELASLPTFSNDGDLLRELRPDAIVISTPHSFHYEQILAGIESGCHVLVEKPMVNTVAEASEVVRRADASDKIVAVSYQRRYLPTFRFMREVIASGRIGDVQFVQALQNQNWYRRQLAANRWRIDRAVSGGGQLNDSGSHLMDILLFITGLAVDSVYCQQQFFDLNVDVNSSLSVQFDNGAVGSLAIVGNAPGYAGQVWEDFTIYGTTGAIYYRQLGQPFGPPEAPLRTPKIELRIQEGDQELEIGELPAGSDPDYNFLEAILGRGQVACTPRDGLRVAELTEAAFASAQSGERVRVLREASAAALV